MGLIVRAWQRAGWFAVQSGERWRTYAIDPASVLARLAPVGLLSAIALMGLGTAWDIQWHATVGRDSPWILPHLAVYSGTIMASVLGFVMLVGVQSRRQAWWADPYGLIWAGSCVMAIAAVIDAIWHELIGDRTLWSPPHALGVAGAVIIVFGSIIAWRRASRLQLFPPVLCGLAQTVLLAGGIVAAYYGLRAPVILAFRPDFPMPPFVMTTSPYVTAGLASLMLPAIVLLGRNMLGMWRVDLAALTAMIIWLAQEIVHRLLTPWFAALQGGAVVLSRAPDPPFGLLTLGFMLVPAIIVNHAARRRPEFAGVVMAALYSAAVAVWLAVIGRPISVPPLAIGTIVVLGGLSSLAGAACARWICRLSDIN